MLQIFVFTWLNLDNQKKYDLDDMKEVHYHMWVGLAAKADVIVAYCTDEARTCLPRSRDVIS